MLLLSAPVVLLDEILKLVSNEAFGSTPAGRMMRWSCKLVRDASVGAFKGKVTPESQRSRKR